MHVSRRRNSTRPVFALMLVAAVCMGVTAQPLRAEVTPDQVRIAIDKAIDNIRKTQANGGWQDFGRQGGSTALNVLALLNAGVPESDKTVQAGLSSLDKVANTDTYIVSLKAMVYRYADAVKYRAQLAACAKWLIESQLESGTWGYNKMQGAMGARMAGMMGDNSNTQFALLGLHEAALGGVAVPKDVWQRSEKHFLNSQLKDGGWGYRSDMGRAGSGYGSMTCAGIASLYITGNQLDVSQEDGYANGVAKNCGNYRQNEAIAKGLLWMARNFAVDTNPGRGGAAWRMYYLYAMERVGMISGLKFYGSRDWYREGAEALIDVQKADGSFPSAPYDTSFALLFLAKGNKPVLFNKLAWGQMGDWNEDRNDIEHLVQFVNKAENGGQKFSQQPVAWQVVNLRVALVDLLDAPILFLNGHAFPAFSEAERKKLREFVDQGGTIFVESCCSKKEFTDGFHAFVKQAWPEYAVDRLPDDHPIFSSFYPISKNEWDLEGLQVGCRTSVIFAPRDMSCLWEQQDKKNTQTDAAMKLGTNVAAYATGLERLKDKLERARVAEKNDASGRPGDIVRGALQIGALAHGLNPLENMPDPNAWPKFAEYLRDEAKIDVVTKLQVIDPKDVELLNHPIMFMTGHNGFKYSEEQIKGIRTWLDRGGFLYANACCGRDTAIYSLPGDPKLTNDFGTSFREMVAELYKDKPEVKLVTLPADHPIRGGAGAAGFYPLAQVTYRAEIEKKLAAVSPAKAKELVIEGVTVNGRLVAAYSPYSITCGLEDHKCFGCRGLVSKDAYKVSANVVLYVLSH
ncbi:MAG: DUF4159 domain-containing protein [Phycisphaerae bacterium]|nr:DUF4159 domain-containing protein [Phycisphaerae bacterium]